MARKVPSDIEQYPFDLIIVGAGINGAGIARDAAMRGLRVLLLDKGDISNGTTQWATRLIHGGLRYLEYYEVALVRESLHDREILLRIAPHLVRPLGFMVPIYERSKRGPRMIRLGMIAYDILSYEKSMPRHRMFGREEALEREPGLNPDGLLGAAFYYDAQAEYAERLAVENAISAREHGAMVITYAKVERLLREGSNVVGVEFSDLLDGGRRRVARAPVTVNVSGPWVDEVLGNLSPKRMIGGTKGSHLVVDPFPGAPKNEALYVEARRDGRPYFIVPWNGRYLIGTTDIPYEGDLDYVSAEEWEIEYLLEETNHVIPQAGLTREDVLYTYAGVRPLPYEPDADAGSITRSHIVYDHARHEPRLEGLVSIIGGKLTTYRNLGRQTTDMVYRKLGQKPPKSATSIVPLPGGRTGDFEAFSERFKAESGLLPQISERLLKLYGARAWDVLEMAGEDPSLREPLVTPATVQNGLIGAEVLYAFEREMAEKLSDVLLRRSMAGLDREAGLDVDEAAAKVAARHFGWDEERTEGEVKEYRDYIRRYHPKALQEHAGGR